VLILDWVIFCGFGCYWNFDVGVLGDYMFQEALLVEKYVSVTFQYL
jgi:hypothetical protein